MEDEGTPCWLRKWINPRYGECMEELIFHTFTASGNAQVNMKHIFFKAQAFLLKPSKSRWTTPGDGQ